MEKCSIYCFTNILNRKTQSSNSLYSGLFTFDDYFLQMYGLMNEISDIYNKRLLEYADKQEIFDIKMYVLLLRLFSIKFYDNFRLNGQYTLDNIASCLFGIETNSLQNENVTLINHLKKFFQLSLTNIFLMVLCKCISMKINISYTFLT
jgi:hypothetical protein